MKNLKAGCVTSFFEKLTHITLLYIITMSPFITVYKIFCFVSIENGM